MLDNGYYYVAIGVTKGLLMVVKRKSKEQEHDKNPIDGIRMSELLTDLRLWKNRHKTFSNEDTL
ncbi:MAG TPA: hypothetical protein VI278_09245 [Nitrososphaeraceae archaeon]